MKVELEPEDFVEIREMLMGNIDFEVTDAEIAQVVYADPYSIATATTWGWNDTEVRERICAALEKLKGVRS